MSVAGELKGVSRNYDRVLIPLAFANVPYVKYDVLHVQGLDSKFMRLFVFAEVWLSSAMELGEMLKGVLTAAISFFFFCHFEIILTT